MAEQTRYSLIVWEMMQVLRDAAEPLTGGQVIDAVRARIEPTAYELERVKSGGVRWEVVLAVQVRRRGDRRLDDQARRLGTRRGRH